jgi:hypothetical protein
MTDSQADTPRHLYDVVSDQRTAVVDGFADQRESLRRAVEDQRLAAMPEAMRRAALGPMGLVGAEIAQVLQHMIAREVTRQLDLAIRNMLAQAQADSAAAKPPAEKG